MCELNENALSCPTGTQLAESGELSFFTHKMKNGVEVMWKIALPTVVMVPTILPLTPQRMQSSSYC
jgi:hypothetical protein